MTTLYLDCETVPRGTLAHIAAGLTLDDPPQDWTCPAYPDPPAWSYTGAPKNWKDPAKIAAHLVEAKQAHERAIAEHEAGRDSWHAASLATAWEDRRPWSLDPLRAEVACLGWAIDDGPVEIAEGPDVTDVLDAVFAMHNPGIIVAHNAGFDAEILWALAVRDPNRVKLCGWLTKWDYRVSAAHRLYKGPAWVDTMDLAPLRRVDRYRFGVGQQALAEHLGVARPHPLRGAEVFDAVMGGRAAEVYAHCRSDVAELRDIYRRLWAVAEVRR